MSLFNLLKHFGKRDQTPEPGKASLPTVTPDESLFECYDEVFSQEMANVSGISREEVTEIYDLISESEGSFLNMGAYFSPVYEKYFKGREWSWIEYEDWNEWFTSLGRFPVSFKKKVDYAAPETALGLLTVSELKKLLSEKNITINSKAKKRELVTLAQEHVDIRNDASVNQAVAERLEKEKHVIYKELMLTIANRTQNLHKYKRATSSGIVEFKIIQGHAADEEFSKMALQKTSRFLPPLYPYDHSYLTSVISFDD